MLKLEQYDAAVRLRGAVEQRIATKLVEVLLEAGFWVSVFDSEEQFEPTRDKQTILDQIGNADLDRLDCLEQYPTPRGFRRVGWVQLVWGNSGWDLVSDNTVNLEPTLKPVTELAEQFAGGEL